MRILYGTTNPAKLASMRRALDPLGIELIGLNDLGRPVPQVDESGRNPLENARIKAMAYYKAFDMPVFSCDSGLYFDGIDEALQPGTHIRRVGGKELTDEEMIAYYSEFAEKNGGRLVGRYRNAVCFIANASAVFNSMDDSLATEPFVLVSKAHPKRVKGFPIDSLSIDISSGEYYFDIEDRTVDQSAVNRGFRGFFTEVLNAL